MSTAHLVNLAYLIAAILFIFGLKGLSHPRTAVRANLLGACGMLLAILVTLLDAQILRFGYIVAGVVVGSAIGAILATKVEMTGMPQMVALLNGFGGLASTLVAGTAIVTTAAAMYTTESSVATAASGLIGAVTFWGSLVAFGKLEEYKFLPDGHIVPYQTPINGGLFALAVLLSIFLVRSPDSSWLYWLIVLISSVLGVLLVMPIGGADMPVVIALLNSYSGLAAASTGFVIGNSVLIIAGSLVGASGIILTNIMCKAMNRSMFNVVFGTMAGGGTKASADEVYGGRVKSTSPEEVAMMLDGARRVVIVPGYGMAVAQAQHAVRDLANLLESRGTEVEFAIHPVAGRMPGHMNVLLAEAKVSYQKLKEMEEINPTMEQVDVVLVVGANDVVNPVARTDPNSPIAGMPIIDVDKARTVVVIKRSLSPGFAGIPNPLFAADNTWMYFEDGKRAFLSLITAVKES